jgi:hypothetical protein
MKRNSTLLFGIAVVILSLPRASAQNAPHPGGNYMAGGRFEHPFAIGNHHYVSSFTPCPGMDWN